METLSILRGGQQPTALALAASIWLLLTVAVQPADRDRATISAASTSGYDEQSVRDKLSDLLIETKNVSGTLGAALPLGIKLIRVRNVYIEAIKLLGLPRGVTISDSSNTYSSASDNNDVDVSSWDLSKIQVTQNDQRESSFSLAVAAIWIPESGGQIDVTSGRLSVNFVPEHRTDAVAAVDEVAGDAWHVTPIRTEAPASHGATRAVAELEAPVVAKAAPKPASAAAGSPVETSRSAPSSAADARSDGTLETARLPHAAAPPHHPTGADPLVERAKGLIRLGDISGARLLLERAEARQVPNATLLLAQTWDPTMLRTWKVRGLRADQDLARNLYAKAASQQLADERLLAAAGR